MIIPAKLLDDPDKNQQLVDVLTALKDAAGKLLTVVESAPDTTELTEKPVILFCLADKKIYLCDTTEWRTASTEEIA